MVNLMIILGITIVASAAALMFALVLWYLATYISKEIREFVDQYKGERRKCKIEDDDLFTKWIQEFHEEPLNTMRDYADAH